jgi:hypothetical protein
VCFDRSSLRDEVLDSFAWLLPEAFLEWDVSHVPQLNVGTDVHHELGRNGYLVWECLCSLHQIYSFPILHLYSAVVECDGNKSLYLVFMGVTFLSILDCF